MAKKGRENNPQQDAGEPSIMEKPEGESATDDDHNSEITLQRRDASHLGSSNWLHTGPTKRTLTICRVFASCWGFENPMMASPQGSFTDSDAAQKTYIGVGFVDKQSVQSRKESWSQRARPQTRTHANGKFLE